MNLKLIEPLRELFKDEVRELGMVLGVSEESVWRHPFPGPGLAIRVLGELSKERLDMLREADAIMVSKQMLSGALLDVVLGAASGRAKPSLPFRRRAI